MNRPVIVLFEGLSGAGKTTQADLIIKNLAKKGLKAISDPTADHQAIEDIQIMAKELSFMDPTRSVLYWLAWTVKDQLIKDYVSSSDADVILIDRLWGSAIVYNKLIFGKHRNIWKELPKISLAPDKTFLFVVSREAGLRRKNSPSLQDPIFFQKLKAEYLTLANEYGWEIVNGEDSMDEINERLVEVITELIDRGKRRR